MTSKAQIKRDRIAILTCLRHAPPIGFDYQDIKLRVGEGIHEAMIELRNEGEIIKIDDSHYVLKKDD